jgi:2-methylcitrate dehydratase PrpD
LKGYTEDPNPGLATKGLSEEYEILNTGLKPYPCCRYMHNPLDLLLDMAGTHEFDPDDVEGVTIEMVETGIELVADSDRGAPSSFMDAQFSMAFGSALAITRGEATVDTLLDVLNGGYDATFRRIMDVTQVTPNDEIERHYPDRWPARVTIKTSEGKFSEYSEYARGEPENPLSWKEQRRKFDRLADRMSGETRRTITDSIDSLEDCSFPEFLELFRR